MSETIKVGFAPEFIQRAMDWAEIPVDISQGEDGQFGITIRDATTTTADALVGKLTSAIIGLYLTYRDDDA